MGIDKFHIQVNQKLRFIRQTIRGINIQAPVIDAVDMLCDLIGGLVDVQLPLPEVQTKVEDVPTDTTVPELKVSKSLGGPTKKDNKPTTGKAKKATWEQRSIPMSDNKSEVEVDSSIGDAVKAIKKEKEAKKKALEDIFSDNTSKRYGPTIDS